MNTLETSLDFYGLWANRLW